MTRFYPEDKDIPSELILEGVKIRQLKATDNDLDYQAVIESGFRPEGFPKEENLKQISKHEEDHNNKIEFAFTILDTEESICYGCLFVKPISPFLKFAFFNERMIGALELGETDPGISFWLTPKGWELGLFEKILNSLINWFRNDWPYERLFYLGMGPIQEEITEIEKKSIKRNFLLQIDETKYILWKLI